jgi:hypothetical protein
MEFEELQTFINEENARLKRSGKVLCATVTNAYDYMVVMVKRSMNLAKDVVAAAASFRIAETKVSKLHAGLFVKIILNSNLFSPRTGNSSS